MPPVAHWIKIQYDSDFNHFLIDGSYKHTPGNMFIDGYTANKRLQEYVACLMHEVEDIQRKERAKALSEKQPAASSDTPTQPREHYAF